MQSRCREKCCYDEIGVCIFCSPLLCNNDINKGSNKLYVEIKTSPLEPDCIYILLNLKSNMKI